MVDLKLYIVTFNCGRKLVEPDAFGGHLLDNWHDPTAVTPQLPDALVLNLQEIAPLSYAFLGNNWLKPYFNTFQQAVQVATQKHSSGHAVDDFKYVNVLARNTGLTAMMLFVREDLADEIQTLNIAEVGVGVSKMGNKGAIGARVGWKLPEGEGILYTTFVSAHLAPFEAEIQRRDQDYIDIVRGLVFTSEDVRERSKDRLAIEDVPLLSADPEEQNPHRRALDGIYTSNSHLFFAGDLNYRTAITSPGRDDSQYFPQPRKDRKDDLHYSHLLEKDQLAQQLQQRKTLHGLSEQHIDFPPTYKYELNGDSPVLIDKDVEEWQWASHRWPSWCDRILFSPSQVQAGKYSALPLFRTSDHRPVSLSISVPLKQLAGSRLAEQAPCRIDQHYKSSRGTARRKEIAVGTAAYLVLTWEGNTILIGAFLFVLGSIYLSKSIS